jgi:hypothetical protein
MMIGEPIDAIARFRELLDADPCLQLDLARHERPEPFLAEAIGIAARHGISVANQDFGPAATSDPIGLARQSVAPSIAAAWPDRDWLPVDLVRLADGRIAVDWAHFGGESPDEAFFALSARRALARPFNRLLRRCTPIDDFLDAAEAKTGAPNGLIFHMSRSGSTLTGRMLAALPASRITSEAGPLDTLLRLVIADAWPPKRGAAAIAAMVRALGPRPPTGAIHIVKLNCWHALALNRFRAAFPATPWVFLYRQPVEVLASQMRRLGTELLPELVHPSLYGTEAVPGEPREAYCARALARVCEAAAEGLVEGGGLAVNYADLPDAVGVIAAHFGIVVGAAERATMADVARRDAKSPSRPFEPSFTGEDSVDIRSVRAAAERHLRPAFDRLEALRATR